MSLNWTAALPMQKLVLIGCLAQNETATLWTDIEMDSLATREPFPTSSALPLQLTFFTSAVICVRVSQINRTNYLILTAVWGTGASRTVVLAYITSIEALLSGKRNTIVAWSPP